MRLGGVLHHFGAQAKGVFRRQPADPATEGFEKPFLMLIDSSAPGFRSPASSLVQLDEARNDSPEGNLLSELPVPHPGGVHRRTTTAKDL